MWKQNKALSIQVGSAVPVFVANTHVGVFDLSAMRGKNVVIYFYPKDNTPGCTMESKAFRDYYRDFQQENTEIIGVSRDSIKSHCKFSENYQLPFSLISDEDESVCKLFNVFKEKSMFGKKYFGVERSTFLIDKDGVLKQEWRDVSVIGHVKNVLKKVQEINSAGV